MRPAASIRRVAAALLASAVASAAALAAGTAAAATLKATLLLPQDDPRLERSRLERGYLGHPGGPAGDGRACATTRPAPAGLVASVSWDVRVICLLSIKDATAMRAL